MERTKIAALPRKKGSKGSRKQLRMKGELPAVVYGRGGDTYLVSLNSVELKRALHTSAGANVVLDMEVRAGDKPFVDTVMVRELQRHPIQKDLLLHADLIRISMKEKLEVSVPLNFVGEPEGVKEHGGVLQVSLREINVLCLPGDIPGHIDVDVQALEIGDSLNVEDLQLPSELEILDDPAENIASVLHPTTEEELEAEEEEMEEAEEGAEEPAEEEETEE